MKIHLLLFIPFIASTIGAPHFGSSPFAPPEADDQHFVSDQGSGLDTGCTFRSGGPLLIRVMIDRYVGPTNPDGTLQNATDLIARGIIGPRAYLRMPAFDVDSGAILPAPEEPEIDKVFLNGK